jgi:hypothetical protein
MEVVTNNLKYLNGIVGIASALHTESTRFDTGQKHLSLLSNVLYIDL